MGTVKGFEIESILQMIRNPVTNPLPLPASSSVNPEKDMLSCIP